MAVESQAGECLFAEINRNGVGGAAFKNPEDFVMMMVLPGFLQVYEGSIKVMMRSL